MPLQGNSAHLATWVGKNSPLGALGWPWGSLGCLKTGNKRSKTKNENKNGNNIGEDTYAGALRALAQVPPLLFPFLISEMPTPPSKNKKTKCVSNDRSRHDDQNAYRIMKIGAILKGCTSVQSFDFFKRFPIFQNVKIMKMVPDHETAKSWER